MEKARQIALERGIAMLKAAGVRFVVVDSNNEVTHGDATLLLPPEPEKKKRTMRKLGFDYYSLYKPVFDEFEKTGLGMHSFALPDFEGLTLKHFHDALRAAAYVRFGKDHVIVTPVEEPPHVEVLLVDLDTKDQLKD